MTPRRGSRTVTLGVAIDVERIVVAALGADGGSRHESFSVAASSSEAPLAELGEALTNALWKTRTALGAVRASVAVALLPPLTLCRVIDMRGLSDEEIHNVLRRDVASYFPVGATSHVVGASRVRHAASRTSAVFATAAPTTLVDAIHDAATAAGCSVTAIVPAAAAWAAAAEHVWAARPTAASTLVAVLDKQVDLLRIEGGQLTTLRRLRNAPSDQGSLIDALGGSAEAMLLGDPRFVGALSRSLHASGIRLTAPVRDPGLVNDPAALAAAFAGAARAGPFLVPEQLRTERRRLANRRAARMMIASIALLVGAAAIELWGLRRELAVVTGERLELRGRLSAVVATRDTVTTLAEQLSALRTAERGAPRWSNSVALVAEYLPRDAHLLSLRAEADSLVLEGVAHRAAPVFEAMARAPAALAVRAQGSIRQEVRENVGQVERFTLSVRLTGGTP